MMEKVIFIQAIVVFLSLFMLMPFDSTVDMTEKIFGGWENAMKRIVFPQLILLALVGMIMIITT